MLGSSPALHPIRAKHECLCIFVGPDISLVQVYWLGNKLPACQAQQVVHAWQWETALMDRLNHCSDCVQLQQPNAHAVTMADIPDEVVVAGMPSRYTQHLEYIQQKWH